MNPEENVNTPFNFDRQIGKFSTERYASLSGWSGISGVRLSKWADQIKSEMFGRLYYLSPLIFRFKAVKFRRVTYFFGYDDTREILSSSKVFATPFRKIMAELDEDHEVSLLGFEDSEEKSVSARAKHEEEYRLNLCQVMRCLSLEKLPWLACISTNLAKQIVAHADGELDVIGQLLVPILIEATQSLFGIRFSDPGDFHRWTMVLSNITFGDPKPSPSLLAAAKIAGNLVDTELNQAIQNLKQINHSRDDVLAMLRDMEWDGDPAEKDNRIRATVAGLLTGMMPNIPIAGFNVIQVLLRQPRAMALAQAAAIADDDKQLQNCIIEALRFRPLDLGVRRTCVAENGSAIGSRPWDRKPIEFGGSVFALTLSAMFDGRRIHKPFKFDPLRPLSDNLAFGAGKHWCVGAPIAICLLTQALKPLLCKTNIRQKRHPSSTFFLGFFPESFTILFDEHST